jgi:hypothetical protein
VDWLNNRTTRQCTARELTYLDLEFLVDLNFEERLMDRTLSLEKLWKSAQSLPPPSSISLFASGVFPNCFPYEQP